MIKINGPVAFFDVDDTLLRWSNKKFEAYMFVNDLEDTHHKTNVVRFKFRDKLLKRYYIQEHIDELKLQKDAGTQIVVWSKSGADWAEAVVEALGITDYVDLVTSKPDRIYDDKEPSEWLPERRYYIEDL